MWPERAEGKSNTLRLAGRDPPPLRGSRLPERGPDPAEEWPPDTLSTPRGFRRRYSFHLRAWGERWCAVGEGRRYDQGVGGQVRVNGWIIE